jgi:SAM-dependent methyltransferase
VVQPCPICGSRDYLPMADRPAGRCAECHSLERQRAVVLAVGGLLQDGAGRACLEAGPLSAHVFGRYLRDRGWAYTSVDRWRTGHPNDPRNVAFVDQEADLTDLGAFADDSFDVFLAQHVIEEIEDYEAALAEIARVLKPGGLAFVEAPVDAGRATSERQQADGYGNVWRFGRDLPDRFARVFARVEPVPLREGTYAGVLLACAAS